MTITLTQTDATRPPVTVAVTGLPVVDSANAAGAVTGIVQRSADGVRYTTVRGMIDMEPDGSGVLSTVSDYEFRPGVVNTYRAGTMQEIVATFASSASSAWPTAETGHTWGGTGAQYNAGSGVATILHSAANTLIATHIDSPTDIGDSRTSVTVATNATAGGITGAAANFGLRLRRTGNDRYRVVVNLLTDDTMTMALFSDFGGVTTTLDTVALPTTYDGATSNASFRLEVDVTGHRVRARCWNPAISPAPDWQIDEVVPAGMRLASGGVGVVTQRLTGNTNTNLTFSFNDFTVDTGTPTYLQTQTITPDLAGFWLCSTMRSFLNLAPRVVGFEEPTRDMRGGANYVAARTLPIAQVELAGARAWTLTLRVPTLAAARQLEYAIASGDVFYLQTPDDCPIPFGFYRVAKMGSDRVRQLGVARLFDLPLEECAAPGPDVATASATWDSVIALYGSWPAVVAAQATWEDLLEIIGDPVEVIVE